ncbi:unnamed protein product [Callosobruchus maculatus]|uniref:Conserved oligomeric Golgi complex subunit 1 n=2 Tax=Callosobruchus maculatus TaxID=64391 RepID=A0A653CUS1_CALMS|nr:unnamed protein product [Callosobruchus maculatus]
MAKSNNNFIESLDIDKLFQERSIDDIIELERRLDSEIEKKRNALRSTVGDRYKDVLAASDAIKSMKTISQDIVHHIDKITNTCENLLVTSSNVDLKSSFSVEKDKLDERTFVAQVRLAIFLNEQIWLALDQENNLDAAQYYLLAQYLHTGLGLSKREFLDKISYLEHIKNQKILLRKRVFQKITEKLESVETTAEDTSKNLNALLLLKNETCDKLLSIFIEHRKTALITVINTTYSSVRVQICSMVKCLITTIHLLHHCFICYGGSGKGLIWQQLEEIVSESSPKTLSKLQLPASALLSYIPEIIKQFRPKCNFSTDIVNSLKEAKSVVESWLQSTLMTVEEGLQKSLQLITNIKGLHLTRVESLKIDLPENWEEICKELHLPDEFNVWLYFFQNFITLRCKELISKKVSDNTKEIQECVSSTLNEALKLGRPEVDLRWYTWVEEPGDISRSENCHRGLSMKTRGYSENIIELCKRVDDKYLALLEDASQYLYGKEYNTDMNFNVKDFKFKRKFVDRNDIENHLSHECTITSTSISDYILNSLPCSSTDSDLVTKSVVGARFLEAVSFLCPHFQRCCTLDNVTNKWSKVCDRFSQASNTLWQNWLENEVRQTEVTCEKLQDISQRKMISIYTRWDEIEIQEQTDDEKVFKSQIRVPLKPSLTLSEILDQLNENLSKVLPHTLPKQVYLQFIEKNVFAILRHYKIYAESDLNQKQALQFLFDVKFLATFCIPRENSQLVTYSQDICDKFRSKVDPFDLDVFYPYLQSNVKRAVGQSQIILGCLLPSSHHLASLGISEKNKEQEQNPSLLALSTPSITTWFSLLPISVPTPKSAAGQLTSKKSAKVITINISVTVKHGNKFIMKQVG